MGGFAKGLRVIEAFGDDGRPMSIADIARTADLDRASARRCVLTLVAAGYARGEDRRYQLTPKILRLSRSYLDAPLPRVLQPFLESLSETISESCSASVLDGTEIVYIARASHHRIMSIGLSVGSRLPAYCTSMGRVLLASLPGDEARSLLAQSELVSHTPRTLTDIEAITAELEKVRSRGYALVDQELELGLRSLAVPIANADGEVLAAVNVGLQAAQVTLERMRSEILPHLLELGRQARELLQ